MRDDYSLLREAHEEPGKALALTASHGRPLYGLLLQYSFSAIPQLEDLCYLRLLSLFLLTLFGILLQKQLLQIGWHKTEAAVVAFIFLLLPATQVAISWATGWPWGLALLLSLAGYNRTEAAQHKQGLLAHVYWLAGLGAYCLAALIYQSHALFATALMAAGLISPLNSYSRLQNLRWLALHLITLAAALILSYGLMKILFTWDIFTESARLQLENHPVAKLYWFLYHPLPNALALLPLRDNFKVGDGLFQMAAILVFILILVGAWREQNSQRRFSWLLCGGLLPWVAHSISLVAAEHNISYRTTFALSALILILAIAALQKIPEASWRRGIYGLLGLGAGWLAAQQSLQLIATPQGREWQLIKNTVNTMNVDSAQHVYLIEPGIEDRSTERIYQDEFGSLSSNSSWVSEEMFKAALRERFPGGIPENFYYHFSHGGEVPEHPESYAFIIDMRNLSRWRHP